MAQLDSRHHTFLQAIMNRGPLMEKDVMKMYKALMKPNPGDRNGFNQFFGAINKELEFVEMEVRKVRNQYDGEEYFGLVNKLVSQEAKLGTKFTHPQIVFFKAVIDAIAQSPGEGCIASREALNLKLESSQQAESQTQSAAMPIKMTMGAKEDALDHLVADHWLSRTDDGGVAVGTRTLLELRSVFRNIGVPFCEVCNEPAIKAQICSSEDCSVRLHSYCVARKFPARDQKPRVCSGCGTGWDIAVDREEMAGIEEAEEESPQIAPQRPIQSLNGARSHQKVRRTESNRSPDGVVDDFASGGRCRQPRAHSRKVSRLGGRSTDEEDSSASDGEENITRLCTQEQPQRGHVRNGNNNHVGGDRRSLRLRS